MQAAKVSPTHKDITSMDEAYIILYSNADQKLVIPTLSQVRMKSKLLKAFLITLSFFPAYFIEITTIPCRLAHYQRK